MSLVDVLSHCQTTPLHDGGTQYKHKLMGPLLRWPTLLNLPLRWATLETFPVTDRIFCDMNSKNRRFKLVVLTLFCATCWLAAAVFISFWKSMTVLDEWVGSHSNYRPLKRWESIECRDERSIDISKSSSSSFSFSDPSPWLTDPQCQCCLFDKCILWMTSCMLLGLAWRHH